MSKAVPAAANAGGAGQGHDFSLVLGGPLYQLSRRLRLSDEDLGLLPRRIIAFVLVAWAPLLILSAPRGDLLGPGRLPFLDDIGFHLRFLVVGPLLIGAELVVHRRMQPIIDQFRIRGLVRASETSRFDDALREAERWRNSVLAEVLLVATVYAVGVAFTYRRYSMLGDGGWFSAHDGQDLSAAGLWLVFVSLPLLQFLLLRWYFRLFIWGRFLWRVARLDLDLDVTHPDKAGGLGFLADSLIAFVPIVFAHGVLLSGMMSTRILLAGAQLTDFQMEVVAGAIILLGLFAGPLLVFGPMLARVKWEGLRAYGALGQVYVREFRQKWLTGAKPPGEPLVGSGDIQSLADLGNSFSSAEQMRFAPIRPTAVMYFLAAYLAPMLPLLLTVMSPEKLIERLVGLVF